MSSAQSGSTVLQDPSPRLIGASFGRVAVIAVLLAYGALALYHLGVPDLDADEGRYGTSALNILNDYHQIAIVSPDPGGVPWSTWHTRIPPCSLAPLCYWARPSLPCALSTSRSWS